MNTLNETAVGTVFEDDALIDAAFYQRPLFKTDGQTAHINDWQRFIGRETYTRWQSDPKFRAVYEARKQSARQSAADFLSSLPWGKKS